MSEGADEVLYEFLVESSENLDQLDADLVALESISDASARRTTLGSVFRTIHTIKGTSGFLAFAGLESLTHAGENLLAKLRDGHLEPSSDVVDGLLTMVDAVRTLLRGIEATGSEPAADHRELVARLEELGAATSKPGQSLAAIDGPQSAAPLLGEVLVSADDTTRDHVEAALLTQLEGDERLIGQILTEAGAADPAAVQSALTAQQEARSGHRSVTEASVRVDVDLLDELMRLAGELVLSRNEIVQESAVANLPTLDRATQRLSLLASELQESIMKTRMQSVEMLWAKLPRVVRDLGAQCGKQVRLELEGGETELDRTVLEAVKDPLTHLVRNAIDHGLEGPDDRVLAGKQPSGLLRLRAYHAGGQVVIDISDDGRGIDPQTIARKAVEKGVITAAQAAQLSAEELTELIFEPGFSTAATVTNVSGRGVGMDVVKTNIGASGGHVAIDSSPGRGTTVRVTLPLTLAIMPALMARVAEQQFAIPQSHLLEVVQLEATTQDGREHSSIEYLAGAPVHRLRGELLPLVSLRAALGLPETDRAGKTALLVLQVESCRFGLLADDVGDAQEIVVKPLGRQLRDLKTYAGATILGDASLALILDVGSVARSAGLVVRGRGNSEPLTVDVADERGAEVLVLDVGNNRRAALPVADVARLERLPMGCVEYANGREVVQYRGGLLPLLALGPVLGTGAPPAWDSYADDDRRHFEVVVWEKQERRVGLVVDAIHDVTNLAPSAGPSVAAQTGVVDSVVIHDRVTDVLDVADLLAAWTGWGVGA